MVCKNCGSEIKGKTKVCKKCGMSVADAEKIQITYDDENVEYVDPPIITEAHTFIDEESFAKKVQEEQEKKKQESKKDEKPRSKWIWLLLIFGLIILVFVVFFVVPKVSSNKSKISVEENMFSSEDWTSGELMIEDEFYQLEHDFSKLYKNGWDIEDTAYPEGIRSTLKGAALSDDIQLVSKFNENSMIQVKLKNKSDKDRQLKNCLIYSITIDNTIDEFKTDFKLPGNIVMGSSELEIQSLYGQLDESLIEKDEVSNYSIYHYEKGNTNLDLTIFENGGLKAFHYYISEGN